MATLDDANGYIGNVTIGNKVLTLTPLSLTDEALVWEQLQAIADKDWKVRTARAYEAAELAPESLRGLAVQQIINNIHLGARVDANKAARTPEGVAVDLYFRARSAHPEITLKEVQAIITSVNALEVWGEVQRVISGPKKSAQSS